MEEDFTDSHIESQLAGMYLRRAYDEGKVIEIPSIGVRIQKEKYMNNGDFEKYEKGYTPIEENDETEVDDSDKEYYRHEVYDFLLDVLEWVGKHQILVFFSLVIASMTLVALVQLAMGVK